MIQLLKIPSGADPLQAARKIIVEGEETEEEVTTDLESLAAVAERAWPKLGWDKQPLGEDRTIYLSLDDENNDFEMELFDSGAIITLPGRKVKVSDDFWSSLATCVGSLQFHTRWVAYDEQQDKVLTFPTDGNALRLAYEHQKSVKDKAGPDRIEQFKQVFWR